MTRLDDALTRLRDDPDNLDARAAYLGALGDTEILLAVLNEPTGDAVEPDLIQTPSGQFALAFDTADRLAEASGTPKPYVALPGRILAEMLASQDIGLAINLGSSSEMVVTGEELSWLSAQLQTTPDQATGRIVEARAPKRLPEALLKALDTQLARAAGLAKAAYLAEVSYEENRRGHLLAILDAVEGSESAFARSIDNALRFSGLDAAELDVAFFNASDPIAARLANVGIRYDLPEVTVEARPAPGSDPTKPPKLR